MKVGLVLEGGGMRGMYTAGVIDSFLDNGVKIDGIMGVSAGALFGVNYVSKQRGRALRYNTKYIHYPMYMGMKSLVKTGNIVNKEFAYYVLPKLLDKFDQKEFEKSGIDYYVVITNVETGLAEYKKITDVFEEMEYLRASSALPLVSETIKIEDNEYLDGGIADSIPLDKMLELGYDKIVLILTQPLEYRKDEKKNIVLNSLIARKYGENMAKTLSERAKNYNDIVEKIIRLEQEEKIFVIRPSKLLNIGRLEKNVDKIKEIYNLGLTESNNKISSLQEYLKSSKEK